MNVLSINTITAVTENLGASLAHDGSTASMRLTCEGMFLQPINKF